MGGLSAATVIKGWQVWRAVKPYKRWKERRQAKREAKREAERLEVESAGGIYEEEEELKVAKYRKLIVVVVGAGLTLGARFVPALEGADAAMLVDAAILAGTALGVWAAPNEQ